MSFRKEIFSFLSLTFNSDLADTILIFNGVVPTRSKIERPNTFEEEEMFLHVVLSANNKVMLTTSSGGKLGFWDCESGKKLVSEVVEDEIHHVAVHNNHFMIRGSKSVSIWSQDGAKTLIYNFELHCCPAMGREHAILAIHENGRVQITNFLEPESSNERSFMFEEDLYAIEFIKNDSEMLLFNLWNDGITMLDVESGRETGSLLSQTSDCDYEYAIDERGEKLITINREGITKCFDLLNKCEDWSSNWHKWFPARWFACHIKFLDDDNIITSHGDGGLMIFNLTLNEMILWFPHVEVYGVCLFSNISYIACVGPAITFLKLQCENDRYDIKTRKIKAIKRKRTSMKSKPRKKKK